jgi:hypothetical protein
VGVTAAFPFARHRPNLRGCTFTVDEATAEAIRRACDEGGELAGVVEFRPHFSLITDNAKGGRVRAHYRRCTRCWLRRY